MKAELVGAHVILLNAFINTEVSCKNSFNS